MSIRICAFCDKPLSGEIVSKKEAHVEYNKKSRHNVVNVVRFVQYHAECVTAKAVLERLGGVDPVESIKREAHKLYELTKTHQR